MANNQFSQYLLNRGVLSADNAGRVLAKSISVAPELAVIALERGLIDAQHAEKLLGVQDFMAETLEDNYLTALQLDELKKSMPSPRARLGQVLLNEGLADLQLLARLFEESKEACCQPVDEVVDAMLERQGADLKEHAHIREYVQLFVRAMSKLAHTDVILVMDEDVDLVDATYLIYQSMGGALRLTAGCRMTRAVLLAMARRFSGEGLPELNDMAFDCIEEFCNVVNGLYIVNMSSHSKDMDLEMPKTIENGVPAGDGVFSLMVETEFGAFMLYLSRDGFVLNERNYFGW